jgi:hypothetical protein
VEFPDGPRIGVADGRSAKLLNCLRRVRRTRSELSRREELKTVVFMGPRGDPASMAVS